MRIALLILAASASAGVAFVGTGGDPVRRSAGSWTVDARVEKLHSSGVPGASDEALAAAMFGKLVGAHETCLSTEEAAKPISMEDFRIDGFAGDECSFVRSDMTGGKVDIAGSCRSSSDTARRDFSVTGTIAPEAMDLLVTFDDQVPAHDASIQSVLRITARRTGPCEAAAPDPSQSGTSRGDIAEAADVAAEEAANALAASPAM